MKNQIACVPDGTPGYVPPDGAAVVPCPRCGRRCWLGPRSARQVAFGAADFACVFCMVAGHGTGMSAAEIRVLDPVTPARTDPSTIRAALGGMDDADLRNLGVDARTNRDPMRNPDA